MKSFKRNLLVNIIPGILLMLLMALAMYLVNLKFG